MISLLSFIEHKKQKAIGSHLPYFLQPIEVEDFLAEHDTLIKRLTVAYSDSQSWDSRILPSIRELALMCGHLPYNANGVFSEAEVYLKPVSSLQRTPSKLWKAPCNLRKTSWRNTFYKVDSKLLPH